MKKSIRLLIVCFFCIFVIAACVTRPSIPPARSDIQERAKITNLAPDFAIFWARTNGQPIDARVAAFKADIVTRFPSFYGIARYAGQRTQAEQDAIIRRAIKEFPEIHERYRERAERLHIALPHAIVSFSKRFPDFRQNVPIYVVHALGEADGGTRSLPGGDVLFFGIDSIVRLHGDADDTPFFHHELFHTYHTPKLDECAGGPMWAYLWVEGLATYVSKVLNPDATDADLLLDIPNGAVARYRATLADSLAQFEEVADSADRTVYRDLFTRAGTGSLPGRRGYYLGYLVANEAARTRDLRTLASLNCNQARQAVQDAVRSLRKAYPRANNSPYMDSSSFANNPY